MHAVQLKERLKFQIKNKQADLNKITSDKFQHLTDREQKILAILLNKFNYMFGRKLGICNSSPVYFQLEYNIKPV